MFGVGVWYNLRGAQEVSVANEVQINIVVASVPWVRLANVTFPFVTK